MFSNPLTDPSRVGTSELTKPNLRAAKKSADQSMVLLKDDNNALPLSKSTSSVAVVGPLADERSTSSARTCRSAMTPTRATSARSTRSSRSVKGLPTPSRAVRPSTTLQGATRRAPTHRASAPLSTPQITPTSRSWSSASRPRIAARPRRGRAWVSRAISSRWSRQLRRPASRTSSS